MKDNEGNDAPLTISRGSGSYLRTYISKQEEDGSQLEIYKKLAKECARHLLSLEDFDFSEFSESDLSDRITDLFYGYLYGRRRLLS